MQKYELVCFPLATSAIQEEFDRSKNSKKIRKKTLKNHAKMSHNP